MLLNGCPLAGAWLHAQLPLRVDFEHLRLLPPRSSNVFQGSSFVPLACLLRVHALPAQFLHSLSVGHRHRVHHHCRGSLPPHLLLHGTVALTRAPSARFLFRHDCSLHRNPESTAIRAPASICTGNYWDRRDEAKLAAALSALRVRLAMATAGVPFF